MNARLNAAHDRLVAGLALDGQVTLTFGALSLKALIDWTPRPDKLAMMSFDPSTAGQVVLVSVSKRDLATAPRRGVSLSSTTQTFRVIEVLDHGHLWTFPCSLS